MRIAVVHNALAADSAPDEEDVLAQVDSVVQSLERLGHTPVVLPCDLDLSAMRERLAIAAPDLVFNLVESLAGTGRLLHLFPALLDALTIAYTGSGTEALILTSNKTLAKHQMQSGGLPTPLWVGPYTDRRGKAFLIDKPPERWIIKSVWEHASIGLDDAAIVGGTETTRLPRLLSERAPRLGGACFAEEFIQGREFNLSVLDSQDGPQVLPPAEIIFEGFADDRPHLVDYQAKWDPDSYAYHHTPRCFDFADKDQSLLARLKLLALQCWQLFDLCGYARVDFRVDAAGQPWILEINANPCLSPDAGFAAAVDRAGLSFDQAVTSILQATLAGRN